MMGMAFLEALRRAGARGARALLERRSRADRRRRRDADWPDRRSAFGPSAPRGRADRRDPPRARPEPAERHPLDLAGRIGDFPEHVSQLQLEMAERARLERENLPPIRSRGLLERSDGFYGIRWQMLSALEALERGEHLIVASRTCSMGVWLSGCSHPYLLHEILIGESLVEPVAAADAHWAPGIEAYALSAKGREALELGRRWRASCGPFSKLRAMLLE